MTKPYKIIENGNIRAAIWRNEYAGSNTFFSVSIGKSYRDKAGNWHNAANFSEREITTAMALLTEAQETIANARGLDAGQKTFESLELR
jgi:hypothetical protein